VDARADPAPQIVVLFLVGKLVILKHGKPPHMVNVLRGAACMVNVLRGPAWRTACTVGKGKGLEGQVYHPISPGGWNDMIRIQCISMHINMSFATCLLWHMLPST
jgi:hypothetical protein